jgi:nifR3 family TIM-barrel protein
MFKIGDLEFKNNLVLSPMAGVCNEAFRILCHDHGAGLVVCEMVSDKALGFRNEKTLEMTKVSPLEHPVSLQIFGADVDSMVAAATFIDENSDCDIIDINMGCPVPKVVKTGAGSALLQEPERAYEIVKSVVEAVKKPVTVKIRIGWDENSINCVEVAKLIEKAGASAITVHGRTRSQFYSGKANWDYIKKVVESVNIPVVGNGDIVDYKTAKEMLDYTGCKAIAIARGALGNPFIFKEINEYLDNNVIVEKPSYDEILNTILKQYDLLLKLKGERLTLLEMRSHIAWYLKGLPGSAKVKDLCNKQNDFNEVKNIIINYFNEIK